VVGSGRRRESGGAGKGDGDGRDIGATQAMLNDPEMTAVGGALGYARSQARSAGARGLVTGPVREQVLATSSFWLLGSA